VNNVEANIVNCGSALNELIELRFMLPPIVAVRPVGDELLQNIEMGAGISICAKPRKTSGATSILKYRVSVNHR
jgi:hypothetical protein